MSPNRHRYHVNIYCHHFSSTKIKLTYDEAVLSLTFGLEFWSSGSEGVKMANWMSREIIH